MKSVIALAVVALTVVGTWTIYAQDDGQTVLVSGQELRILPLSTVTQTGPHVLDVTDTSARVNFVSTVPLACYLVYGPDENFGAVTNDPNMSQAAIIDHNPVMRELEPDTEYVFRMQGVSEDGVLYVSELYSFRTLAASEQPNDNLLSPDNGAVVTDVSSNFGDQPNDGRWGIFNAVDGNPATEWSSNGDGDDAYFVIELGGAHQIDTIEYWTRAMADGTAITESFTVTIDTGETFGPFELPGTDQAYVFEVDFVTSTLRFDVETSTGGNTGVREAAAYGSPVTQK